LRFGTISGGSPLGRRWIACGIAPVSPAGFQSMDAHAMAMPAKPAALPCHGAAMTSHALRPWPTSQPMLAIVIVPMTLAAWLLVAAAEVVAQTPSESPNETAEVSVLREAEPADQPVPADEGPLPMAVEVGVEQAYLRAGPGDDYYPTERLALGRALEVWAIDSSGWCAVRPVAGSFSWVRAADIDDEAALEPAARSAVGARGTEIGVVVADGAVARVGSQINDLRHVAQVRLEAGERVRVLQRVRIDRGRHAGLWARIEPPSGEFRWVRSTDLAASPALRQAALDAGVAPAEGRGEDRRAAEEPIGPLRAAGEAITLTVNESPAPSEPPVSMPPPQPLGAVPQAKRMMAGWLPRGTGVFEAPPPVAVAAPPVSTADELADIDLALSVAVAGPPDTWNLPQLRERLRLAATRSNSNPDRLRADAIDARIARFEAIQAKQQSLAAGPPGDPSPLRLGSMWSSLGGVGSRPIRPGVLPGGGSADGRPGWTPPDATETTGRLATVVSRRPDAPRWALVDGSNNVLVFVNPQPGVNLAPLVGQQISVRGARGYMPEYKRPYLVATEARPRVAQTAPPPRADLTR
jgi:hypothetical protein